MPIETTAYTCHQQETEYKAGYTPEPRQSRPGWMPTSMLSLFSNMPDWRNPFEDFYHDEEMFGPGTQPLQVVEDIPNFYIGPPTLFPDSPPA